MDRDACPSSEDPADSQAPRASQGMSNARARVWFRRSMWLLGGALAIFAGALWFDLPHMWIGPAFAFACAEVTRRICAESNPGVPLRWCDILKVMKDPVGAPLEGETSDLGHRTNTEEQHGQ